ncbi:MAG: 50S ribosomal protein L37ae [Haloferacaceae archaeon]
MADNDARSVGSAGRFGARYGRVARRRVKEIESGMRSAEVDGDDVTRIGTGIWRNEETGEVFTGGAYRPRTPGGRQVTRSIRAAFAEDDEEIEGGD